MTSEQNMPEVQPYQGSQVSAEQQDGGSYSGQQIPPGMGTSKSSRRRRRKRKNKAMGEGAGSGTQQGQDPNQTGGQVPSMQAAAQPQQFQQGQQNFYGGGQPPQQGSGGGKRWKKKFRTRERRGGYQQNPGNVAEPGNGYDTHQPGNTSYGGKRGKNKQQRQQRGFVGPMDHSYREVKGNFADGPPSTIDTGNYRRNGQGGGRTFLSDSGPIDYSVGRPIPVDENAPTKIYFFIEDLFFLAKIQETARKLGVKVAFVKAGDKEAIAQLALAKDEEKPGLIVFDLNNANAKPFTLIPKLRSKLKKGTSIVGFLSHLQGDLKVKAAEAGCDTVLTRAAFSQSVPNLLRRYGAVEEDDANNYNQ